ncbi:ATP-grasp domain-containing protein [Halomonas sediminis]
MLNVLLACAGRRHYLASYFNQALGQTGRLVGTDMDLSAPALQACDVAHQLPGVFAENYLDALKEVVVKEKVDMVFSLNDLEIGLLAENRDQFERETGATVYVPPVETYQTCSDKWYTYQFARELGIDTPETFISIDNALRALKLGKVRFPLIVKPRWGSASIGLFFVESEDDLEATFQACRYAVAKSALASLGTENAVIIQEVIVGSEFGVDVLYGKNENFIGFSVKRKTCMRAGETDKSVTVSPDPFSSIVEKLVSVLPHRGNMDCDFFERDGRFYLLELNPRFGGGYPFTHMAGANHVQMLIDDYQGRGLIPYNYQLGKAFAKFDTLVEVPV